jgi:predicted transcriptional regulator of viral defense system
VKLTRAMSVLAGYTADQWGLVTTAQANTAGVDNSTLHRLTEAGLLDRVVPRVYAASTAVEDRLRPHQAAWLLLEPDVPAWERSPLGRNGGVVSHRSAATALAVGDLVESQVEISVPRRRTTRNPGVRLRVRTLVAEEVTEVNGLPVTTVERTVDDLLDDGVDGGHVGDLIAHALRRGLTTRQLLIPRLGRHCRRLGVRGHDGDTALRQLLTQATTGHRRHAQGSADPTAPRYEAMPPDCTPTQ